MTEANFRRESDGPWSRYVPDETAPWNLRRAVHLHRRAGFAASWDELQRDLKDGPDASVDRLLRGESRLTGVPESFESTSVILADAAVASDDPMRLKAWWVYRMLFGPDPLGERLTLLWHDHFATSNLKVEDLGAMRRQNELFRQHAHGKFGTLLEEAVRDPALLAYLDAPANRKGHPNENLARELLELFTLGIGNYTEADVKNAARALTGRTVAEGRFVTNAALHDDGEKEILGRKGRWTGDDLMRMLRENPNTAVRLARRLCSVFLGEAVADASAIDVLAAGLRRDDLDSRLAVSTILHSRLFFSEKNLGSRVVGPVEYVIGPVRALELLEPPPSTLVLADWIARLGLDLFYPPNVGGWPGGRAWLATRTIIGRTNYAFALVAGDGIGRAGALDALGIAERHGHGTDRDVVIAFFTDLLLGGEPHRGWHERIASALGPATSWGAEQARRAVALIVSAPEAQLC